MGRFLVALNCEVGMLLMALKKPERVYSKKFRKKRNSNSLVEHIKKVIDA
jgi:hypothetical protein